MFEFNSDDLAEEIERERMVSAFEMVRRVTDAGSVSNVGQVLASEQASVRPLAMLIELAEIG